jgi:hypothetical protein
MLSLEDLYKKMTDFIKYSIKEQVGGSISLQSAVGVGLLCDL